MILNTIYDDMLFNRVVNEMWYENLERVVLEKKKIMSEEEIAVHIKANLNKYLSEEEQKQMLYSAFKGCGNARLHELFFDIHIFYVSPSIQYRINDLVYETITEDDYLYTITEEELINEEGDYEYVYITD